jgi:hypothetical protein
MRRRVMGNYPDAFASPTNFIHSRALAIHKTSAHIIQKLGDLALLTRRAAALNFALPKIQKSVGSAIA